MISCADGHFEVYGAQQDRKRAAEAGFDFHFLKPVSVRNLVVALDKRVVCAGVEH